MAENLSTQAILEQAINEFQTSGIMPGSLTHAEVKKTITVLGITPEDFSKEYSPAELNYDVLKTTFKNYCKDFGNPLTDKVASKALEFSAKILFELGPNIRNEKKYKGNKAIRFWFPYVKNVPSGSKELSMKAVIVSTCEVSLNTLTCPYNKMEDGDKMIMTFKQAGLLAMETFTKAIDYCYNMDGTMLMTPLCRAVFSQETVSEMSLALKMSVPELLKVMNQSTTTGGQYLQHSDMSCSIASAIAATKRVTDKTVTSMMIMKTIKQYSHKQKQYNPNSFVIYLENALGGVPPGMDPDTLIENFTNIQESKFSPRTLALAVRQSLECLTMSVPVSAVRRHT